MAVDLTLVHSAYLYAILIRTGSPEQGETKDQAAIRTAVELYRTYSPGSLLTALQQDRIKHCKDIFELGEFEWERLSTSVSLISRIIVEENTVNLISVILGAEEPDKETAQQLIEEFGSPKELLRSMAVDVFESLRQKGAARVQIPKTKIEDDSLYRLIAVIELEARHGGSNWGHHAALGLERGMFGLESSELVELLNPGSYKSVEDRNEKIEVLRPYPKLAEDFKKLDRLVEETGASNYCSAVEFSLKFEWLCRHRTWHIDYKRPREIYLFDRMLAIAQKKTELASGDTGRLLDTKVFLETAAKDMATALVKYFVEDLARRHIPQDLVEEAFEEIRLESLKNLDKVREEALGTVLPLPV